jgi:hypothetical protein
VDGEVGGQAGGHRAPTAGLLTGAVEEDEVGSVAAAPDHQATADGLDLDALEPGLAELHPGGGVAGRERALLTRLPAGLCRNRRRNHRHGDQRDDPPLRTEPLAAPHHDPSPTGPAIRNATPAWL